MSSRLVECLHDFRQRLLVVAVAVLMCGSSAAWAATAYVTDMLQLDLYDNRELNGSVQRKLRSGDAVDVLERDGRVARVRLENGQTGWVKSMFLVTVEPARTRVNSLEQVNSQLERTLAEVRAELAVLYDELAELDAARNGNEAVQIAASDELERLQRENAMLMRSLQGDARRVPLSLAVGAVLLALLGGAGGAWYWFDSRSRARHGGYRVY